MVEAEPEVEGESLAARIARTPLGRAETFDVLRGIVDALEARGPGFVHGDLWPATVLLAGPGPSGVKLLAAEASAEAARADVARVAYMAPERFIGDPLVPATDVWSLALLAFAMLTGDHFFVPDMALVPEERALRLAATIRLGDYPNVCLRTPRPAPHPITAAFAIWFDRCVTPEPSARFASVTEALAHYPTKRQLPIAARGKSTAQAGTTREDAEAAFLADVRARPDDADTRLVYADWLEEQGRVVESEYLRVQVSLRSMSTAAHDFEVTGMRLRGLAAQLDAGWRAVMARTPIEGCELRFDFVCPKQWDELAPTELGERIRYCGACKKNVHYAISEDDANEQARAGHCVVVDVLAPRSPRGLGPPEPTMHVLAGAVAPPPPPPPELLKPATWLDSLRSRFGL